MTKSGASRMKTKDENQIDAAYLHFTSVTLTQGNNMYGAGDPLGVSQKVVVRDQPSQRFGKPLKEERGEQALSTKKGKQQGSGSALGEEEKEEAEEKAKRKQRRQCILNPDCREESTTGELGEEVGGAVSSSLHVCLGICLFCFSFFPFAPHV